MNALRLGKGWKLLITVVLASTSLIFVNFFTMKVTSAVRAYINGESHYSKGQKDASMHLIQYLVQQDPKYFDLFNQEIRIPQGDGIARTELLRDGEIGKIREGFAQGKNHPDDIDNLIWLFKNFKEVPFMQKAIIIWGEADVLVSELYALGNEIDDELKAGEITGEKLEERLNQINVITALLTIKEREFSENLGVAARKIRMLLFLFNLGVIVIIVGSAAIFSGIMISDLQQSREKLRLKNEGLIQTNKKLDHFIYASSHDLKSPINNLEGLLNLYLMNPPDADPMKSVLLEKMRSSVDTLKITISDIENLIKVDKNDLDDMQRNTFSELLNTILAENEVSFDVKSVEIRRNFEIQEIIYSKIALKSIMYNLVSNAIKYRTQSGSPYVSVSTFLINDRVHLTVADNGLGMDLNRYGDKLYTMFKRFHSNIPGSGLGLYAVKQIIEKNKGEISVQSAPNKGSVFTVVF